MTVMMLAIGVFLAAGIIAASTKVPGMAVKGVAGGLALLVLFVFVTLSSIRLIGEDELGVVVKNFGRNLSPGQIIATEGEKGPQAGILPPGWHLFKWPGLYDIEIHKVTRVKDGEVGLLTAADGRALPAGEIYAVEWDDGEQARMVSDSRYFLTEGGGYKGPQASVLKPGTHRFNPKLFTVEVVPATNIEKAMVGVVKSNVGTAPPDADTRLVVPGQRGIWEVPYTEQKLYLHTKAYEITLLSTRRNVVRYTAIAGQGGQEREIRVRSSDGFTFPVDVRVEYHIKPEEAPMVVAALGDDREKLSEVLTSAVRAIFRNNAEAVKALDYVQQRSLQESQSLAMLAEEMIKVGVTVTAVRIGDVGDEETLGTLLKTQTDREIALQEQITFQEQQRAAEQRKALMRTEQEAEAERDLATATYGVKIAEQAKERVIIEANAEAEAIGIKAEAQALAYQKIAEQIGRGNAALIELLQIVGERGINITPRVMVTGQGGSAGMSGGAETTALIGTMLDTMMEKSTEDGRTADGQ